MIYICNQEKLKKIKLNNDNYYVISDFDHTMTAANSATSWNLSSEDNKEFIVEAEKLYNKYRPIELDPNIDYKEKYFLMKEWAEKALNLLIKYNIKMTEIENVVSKSTHVLRKGAEKFLKDMYDRKIPVLMLSAGVGNVIVEILKHNNILFDNIYLYSNMLTFENNIATGLSGEIIHSMNKNAEELEKRCSNLTKDRKYAVLFGDILADIDMVSKEKLENTITIAFLDTSIEENLEIFKKEFDIVCTNNTSFTQVQEVLSKYNK